MLVTIFYESTIMLKHVKQNKNYLMWYKIHNMCRPWNECVKGWPDILNFWHWQRDLSITAKKNSTLTLTISCTYNPIVSITWATCSSPDGLTAVSALLPFVLLRAPNTCIFALIEGEYCDRLWDNSILMASFNSYFIFSRLSLFSCSNSLLHSSLRFSIISFVYSSLRLPIISSNCCWAMDVEELLEPRDALP